MDQKKGWVLHFNEFVSGQKLFDIKKLGLKAGSTNDDTFLKIKLYVDMNRAVEAPTYRGSYALLYINNQFIGLYFMHEDIAPDFMDGRIHDDTGDGNLMKLYYNVHLQYFGPELEYYYTKNVTNAMGKISLGA
jgi:spore coat protein CotH